MVWRDPSGVLPTVWRDLIGVSGVLPTVCIGESGALPTVWQDLISMHAGAAHGLARPHMRVLPPVWQDHGGRGAA